MGKKSEARKIRKAQRVQRFNDSKAKLVETASVNRVPRLRAKPEGNKGPRVSGDLANRLESLQKQPKAQKGGSRFSSQVSWCRTRADLHGAWSWGEPRLWTTEEWNYDIEPAFLNFQQLAWGEVDKLASGTGHKMHHDHEIGDLIKEAQDRWMKLDLEQYDTVFRFRLGGQKRVWGFIVQAHFHIVWWDRYHKIYQLVR